jgi:hypothetical protein
VSLLAAARPSLCGLWREAPARSRTRHVGPSEGEAGSGVDAPGFAQDAGDELYAELVIVLEAIKRVHDDAGEIAI